MCNGLSKLQAYQLQSFMSFHKNVKKQSFDQPKTDNHKAFFNSYFLKNIIKFVSKYCNNHTNFIKVLKKFLIYSNNQLKFENILFPYLHSNLVQHFTQKLQLIQLMVVTPNHNYPNQSNCSMMSLQAISASKRSSLNNCFGLEWLGVTTIN